MKFFYKLVLMSLFRELIKKNKISKWEKCYIDEEMDGFLFFFGTFSTGIIWKLWLSNIRDIRHSLLYLKMK